MGSLSIPNFANSLTTAHRNPFNLKLTLIIKVKIIIFQHYIFISSNTKKKYMEIILYLKKPYGEGWFKDSSPIHCSRVAVTGRISSSGHNLSLQTNNDHGNGRCWALWTCHQQGQDFLLLSLPPHIWENVGVASV